MFDFHLHSNISFDSNCPAEIMIKKAEELGLEEICFTDHYDFWPNKDQEPYLFLPQDYNNAYNLKSNIKVRKGVEFGLTKWNQKELTDLLKKQNFDFVIGSMHYLESGDPYNKPFWKDKTVSEALNTYFTETYECVKLHSNFNVLGHLTYISKCPPNPEKTPILYKNYADIFDGILNELVKKGIGLEVNTSGIDTCNTFLPDKDFLKRFKELGGEIVTVGSDSHDEKRVGQYCKEATEMLKEIFGYVCTFEDRKPIFHKL